MIDTDRLPLVEELWQVEYFIGDRKRYSRMLLTTKVDKEHIYFDVAKDIYFETNDWKNTEKKSFYLKSSIIENNNYHFQYLGNKNTHVEYYL